uniref:Uncharacterized protein n=1 Tax=Erpetoichthys calabaricus TaxID=27687 RepID=A0A8C4X9F7_ERPCA
MTRTDPPDILVSTVYRDITVHPTSTHAKPCSPSRPCDSRNASTLEDNQETFNKRHCRSFDFLESLDDLRASGTSMEYPYWRADRQTLNPEVAWNALSQQGHLRFSSPDLFNSKVPLPPAPVDAHHAAGEEKKRTRSRSAPRVKTAFTPVAIEVSPPPVRRGREAQRGTREAHRRAEASPHREALYAASRAMMNEVHPIKLQPQRGELSRYSPLFVPDCLLQSHPEKPATSPHVRCRVDIKPDEAVLHHAGKNSRSSSVRAEVPWQRYSSGGSRGLTVPPGFQAPSSRTPTPTDSYSGDYKQLYPLNSEGFPPADVFLQQVPSSRDERDYAGREQRAYSSSSVPTSFFYTEDTGRHTTPAITVGSIYSEDHPTYAKVDQSARWVHTLPPRSYYTDEPTRYPVQSSCAKPYSAGRSIHRSDTTLQVVLRRSAPKLPGAVCPLPEFSTPMSTLRLRRSTMYPPGLITQNIGQHITGPESRNFISTTGMPLTWPQAMPPTTLPLSYVSIDPVQMHRCLLGKPPVAPTTTGWHRHPILLEIVGQHPESNCPKGAAGTSGPQL